MAERATDRTAAAYVASLLTALGLLYVVNMIPTWNVGFVTDDYPAVLWAVNLSLLVRSGGKLALVFYHPRLMHRLANVVFDVFSLLALIIVVTVFPLDFGMAAGPWGTTIIKVVLLAAAVGTAVSAIANLAKAVHCIIRYRDE